MTFINYRIQVQDLKKRPQEKIAQNWKWKHSLQGHSAKTLLRASYIDIKFRNTELTDITEITISLISNKEF